MGKFSTGVSYIHNYSKQAFGVLGRPVVEGGVGAGGAYVAGRWVPAVGGPVGMAVSAAVVAGGCEAVLWGFGRDASVQATQACKGLKTMKDNFDAAKPDGEKEIEKSIRDFLGTENAALADAFILEMRAQKKKANRKTGTDG